MIDLKLTFYERNTDMILYIDVNANQNGSLNASGASQNQIHLIII